MENNKTTLYLGALCILLVIWGSIIDGKRHIVEKKLSIETSRIASAEETAEKERAESASLNNSLEKLNKKLSEVGINLNSCNSDLKNAGSEVEKLRLSNNELKAKLEEKTISMVRLIKVNNLLKQKVASMSSSMDAHAEDLDLQRIIDQKTAEIERLEAELKKAHEEIKSLREGSSNKDSVSTCPEKCPRISELENACSSRTRICNRARTQLSSALKDCNKALEITQKNKELLSEKIHQCKDNSEIEMYRLNISVLLSKIQEQNDIISRLKARLEETNKSG